jgi:hypothetical protein
MSTGRADALLVDVVGADQATGSLVMVAGELETPNVTAPDSGNTSMALASRLSLRTDSSQPYGPLFADVTTWQPSAGPIDVTSGVTGDGTLSGSGTVSGIDSSSAGGASSGAWRNAANGMGMQGTIEGVTGTPVTGTIDGTIGSSGSGTIEGTIGPIATATLQGTVTDPSPVPLPPSAGLFAAGAAAWAGWRRWMRRAGGG